MPRVRALPLLPPPGDTLLIGGTVERVTFHHADSGFAVLRVRIDGRREPATVVGHIASVAPGEEVQGSGAWVVDKTHGLQFKTSWLRTVPPTSLEGIEKYLGSGLIRGIGRHYAKKLTAAFGTSVFDVIEREPSRLRDVEGIGPLRAQRIAEGWTSQRAVRDIMVFLHGHGVGTSRAVRIHRTYGAEAIAAITADPYRLARDIRGIGFVVADRVAERLGVAKDAVVRLRAGLGYALQRAQDEGHCGLPIDEMVSQAAALLGVEAELVRRTIADARERGLVVEDSVDGVRCGFLPHLHQAEEVVAARLAALARGVAPWPAIDAAKAIPWVEQKVGLTLGAAQREALTRAVVSKVLVVTGGPGVGKTTLLKSMLAVLRAKHVRVALAAPTGRAAKRAAEATGLEAKTIHRLLEVNPRDGSFRRDERHPLDCDLLVIDEASMVDVPLMAAVTRALPDRAALWLVGDVDQLPSVGPGQVLADVIAAGVVPVVRLTDVFRQSSESDIIDVAHAVNRGEVPDLGRLGHGDCLFVDAPDLDRALPLIVELVTRRLPAAHRLHPTRDIQVLCPMNRGSLGVKSLNVALQQALNPTPSAAVERFSVRFGVGDKVMQIENDYDKEVYNGDIGVVSRIDDEEGELAVAFDARDVVYDFDELDRLVLAYASSIHKAQGSEYPAVVVPLTTQHYLMLQRRLLYTAVTRARRLVVLVGQRKALALAVRGRDERVRWSRVRERLVARAGGAGVLPLSSSLGRGDRS
ncbi:MAG: ATP-dependent RecD-like DNA helicase [Vicinamibacterales bacterium]